jgi:predicted O-methyltransferase YrrM
MINNYYEEIVKFSKDNPSDISQHLPYIFQKIIFNLLQLCPKLIVELGVCSGQSTKVFNYINKYRNSKLLSIDINMCNYENIYNGSFVLSDDIEFASKFSEFCKLRNVLDKIDILFIDTSHEYEHTKQEIDKWFPYLNEEALIIFHDTNMPGIYCKNNQYLQTWDNNRGVIKAIQEYFNMYFFEERPFNMMNMWKYGYYWHFEHIPESNGLTIITKSPKVLEKNPYSL